MLLALGSSCCFYDYDFCYLADLAVDVERDLCKPKSIAFPYTCNKIQVETCKERIISLELQEPELEQTALDDEQPPLELVDDSDEHEDYDDEEDEEEEEEEDTASIVTVHANNEKLFLRQDADAYGPSSIESISSGKVRIKPAPLTLHQTLAKEILLPAAPTTTTIQQSTIVEVVNPVISGDGSARTIQVGRSHDDSNYPSFDAAYEDDDVYDEAGAAALLRSETFVLPDSRTELSLNAKMKNVLEELLGNERVKLNLQKSLEEHSSDEGESAYGDARDDDESAYGDARDDADVDVGASDVVDFADLAVRAHKTNDNEKDNDTNGNQQLLDELIRDSNRNTIMGKLAGQLCAADEDDEEEDDDDDDDEDEEESSESDDTDDESDSEEEEHNAKALQGLVIENLNTGKSSAPAQGSKLQKSQTYNTMKEAAVAEQSEPETIASDTVDTLAQLQAEQRALAEISKQLRKSVEDLLSAEGAGGGAVVETRHTYMLPAEDAAVVTVTEVVKKSKKSGKPSESGETLFNRLLSAGDGQRQIFDEQTGETITTTTTTTESVGGAAGAELDEPNTSVVTTTRTVSNIMSSGIPRPESSKQTTTVTTSRNNRNKNKRKGKKK